MKTLLLFCISLIIFDFSNAQVSYSITPAKTLTVTAPNTGVTIFDIYQKNTSAAKIILKWQRILVSLPPLWQYSMCDYGNCYSGIPLGPSTMDTIPGNGQGFLGLNIDPGTGGGSGLVKVYVYQNGFQNNGDTLTWYINASAAGVLEITANSEIKIFPNPMKDLLHVNFNSAFTENLSAFVTDALGRKVLNFSLSNYNNSIDISDLENGFYNLIIETKDKQFIKRLVKVN